MVNSFNLCACLSSFTSFPPLKSNESLVHLRLFTVNNKIVKFKINFEQGFNIELDEQLISSVSLDDVFCCKEQVLS